MKTRWRLLFRLWIFTLAAVAVVYLFRSQQEGVRDWMRGRVVEVKDCRTFGFQPAGKDFWLTARVERGCERGQDLEPGQLVEVCPVAFEMDGAMRARVRR